MKYKTAKFFIIAFIIMMTLYFTNDFQIIDIEKTAIIVALAIDQDANQSEMIEVTAQIAIPQATNTQATNSDAIIDSKGKTLYEALNNVSIKTGWYPKLTFCNLIIFGEDLIESKINPLVEYLLSSYRFENSAILATAKGKAKEVLTSSTPLDFISSFALQKILLRTDDRPNTVVVTDIREFAVNINSQSQYALLPQIKVVHTDDKPKQDNGSSSGGGQSSQSFKDYYFNKKDSYLLKSDYYNVAQSGENGKSGGGGSESQSNNVVFDTSTTILFTPTKSVGQLNLIQTLCYNLIFNPTEECFYPLTYYQNEKQVETLIAISHNNCKVKLKFENNNPTLSIKLTLPCEKEQTTYYNNPNDLVNTESISKDILIILQDSITKNINDLFKISKQNKIDFFELKNKLFRYYNDKYYSFKDGILDMVSFKVDVKCVNAK